MAGVYDILSSMRRCRINLPNRCCHLISRVARRAFEFEGLQAANWKGRYDKEKLLWQFTVAIKSFDLLGLVCVALGLAAYAEEMPADLYYAARRTE